MFNKRYVRSLQVILYGAFLLAFATARAAAADLVCAAGQEAFNSPTMSGCVRVDGQGRRLRVGTWRVFHRASGQLIQEVVFNDRGEQHGPTRLYSSKSGQLLNQEFYSHNEATGVWSFWYPNGLKREERSYEHGIVHGIRKRWDDTGVPRGMECYVRGERRAVEECSALQLAQHAPGGAQARRGPAAE